MTPNTGISIATIATNGLGDMSPFETSAANPLALLGACPIEDLIAFTTVSR